MQEVFRKLAHMTLKERIQNDIRAAMKSGDGVLLSTLRLAASAIHNKEIEKRTASLSDEDVLAVLATEAKRRKEAAAEYEKGGRKDLAAKERAELAELERYLPAQLAEAEVRATVARAIQALGASGPKDTGRVMGSVMKELKGRADGFVAQKIAQELLAKPPA